jgi:hypothetical protein
VFIIWLAELEEQDTRLSSTMDRTAADILLILLDIAIIGFDSDINDPMYRVPLSGL